MITSSQVLSESIVSYCISVRELKEVVPTQARFCSERKTHCLLVALCANPYTKVLIKLCFRFAK